MKTISLLALLLCIAPCLTADGNKMTGVSMLSVNSMITKYGFRNGNYDPYDSRVYDVAYETFEEVATVEGDGYALDTPEEFLTATYFSPIEIQDAQARIRIQEVLPQDNPSVAGARLGAMWYQKLVAYQFAVGDTPESREQIGRYELIMNTISERTGATRAEMVATFRAGVREIVAEKVEREFNKISFVIDTAGKTYSCSLIRDAQTGHYTLEYGGYFADNPEQRQVKELTATSLDALVAQMARSSDFNQATIAVVRNQAEVIPGVVYGSWKEQIPSRPDALARWTDLITEFYMNPSQENYQAMRTVFAKNSISGEDRFWRVGVMSSFQGSLYSLSQELGRMFERDIGTQSALSLARRNVDNRYTPLWAPYAP